MPSWCGTHHPVEGFRVLGFRVLGFQGFRASSSFRLSQEYLLLFLALVFCTVKSELSAQVRVSLLKEEFACISPEKLGIKAEK